MATIETFAMPTWLYRYRSLRSRGAEGEGSAEPGRLDRELKAIERGYVWCSRFDHLNDPMEGLYRADVRTRRSADYDRFVESVRSEKLGVGIGSFSETWDNELMWAHYADGFRGICVTYKLGPLTEGLSEDRALVRIAYGDRPHYLNLRAMEDTDLRARAILSTKNLKWAYEREWRLFSPAPGMAEFGTDVVPTVYLGARMADADRRTVERRMKAVGVRVRATTVDGYSVRRAGG